MEQTPMTRPVAHLGQEHQIERRRFCVSVVGKPEARATSHRYLTVGSAPGNDLVVDDSSVSRRHLRFESEDQGVRVIDLGSTNGTSYLGLRIESALLAGEAELQLGDAHILFSMTESFDRLPLYQGDRFGHLWGESPVMRETFAVLERAARSEISVLLRGENGTGKELAAEALHEHSHRSDRPFVVVDCSAMPASLIESELFGHRKGAFTGAVSDRVGAFELASGGTLFIDELGELELSLQPRLLRAIESQKIKRLGEDHYREVDVRVIAATNCDLERMVARGDFREDLYHRIAVLSVDMPPLRHRGADIEGLACRFWREFCQKNGHDDPAELAAEQIAVLRARHWSGNVRELRNFIERAVVLGFRSQGTTRGSEDAELLAPGLHTLPFLEAKQRTVDLFERTYLQSALQRTDGNVAAAARECGLHRGYFFRLIKKHDLKPDHYRKSHS